MRLLISVVALSLALVVGDIRAANRSQGAVAAEVWPLEVATLDPTSLAARSTRVDGLAASLPPELAPAVRYQKTFARILSGAPEAEWADEMRRLAETPGDDGFTRGLREVGKFWVARLEMKQIGEALSGFYIHEIRFPEKLSLVEADLPVSIRRDPWGEAWVYKLKTQDQFAGLDGQGYQLGPARLPALSLLRRIRQARRLVPPAWKISAVSAGGRPALEFRSAASTALIQPGGVADGCTLLYIGPGWALLAQVDQLFTVSY